MVRSIKHMSRPICRDCRNYDFEAVQGELGLCKRVTYKKLLVHPYDECPQGEWREESEEGMSRLREGDIILDRRSMTERYFLCVNKTRFNETLVYSGVTVTKMSFVLEPDEWHVQRCIYERATVDPASELYPVVGHADVDKLIIDGVLKAVSESEDNA